jgi:uncharacterized damage-inducible protein DinB
MPDSRKQLRAGSHAGSMPASNEFDLPKKFLEQARHSLAEHHLPRVIRCLELLSDEDIWWRPNRSSNSIGNLVLHLTGNVTQWILSGLGGAPDVRKRDGEFRAKGPIPRPELIKRLETCIRKATSVIAGLNRQDLKREHSIQGFRVTGFQAVSHVTEHFAYHSGQVVFITKLRLGKDLGFTRLPGDNREFKRLPAL